MIYVHISCDIRIYHMIYVHISYEVYIYCMICEISNFSGIFVQTAPHTNVTQHELSFAVTAGKV